MDHNTFEKIEKKEKKVEKKFSKPAAIVLAMLIVGGAFYYFSRGDEASQAEFVVAKRGDIVQSVSVTGRVKPAESVNLAFENAGTVAQTYVSVGQTVSPGRTLLALENRETAAELAEARARVRREEAKLAELRVGTRPEELRVQEVKVANARVSLSDNKRKLIDALRDAYTKSEDAIRNKVDQFMTNPRGANPELSFTVGDFQLELSIESGRVTMEALLGEWRLSLDGLSLESDLNAFVKEGKENLDTVKSYLEDAALAVNALKTTASLTQSTIDSYRSDISTARTNVNTAISNVTAADEKVKDAEALLALEEENLTLKQAGETPQAITAQDAKLEEARAQVEKLEATLAKTVLRAPIAGVVTKQDAEVGEIVSANTAIVAVSSASEFEIEVNVPEVDVAKLTVGDEADVTLDAYGSDVVFLARVVAIDPAETIIEGVPTYKTTLQFAKSDDRVRSGMTANIEIKTGSREDVLAVPARAVLRKDGEKIVRILELGGVIREVSVETGLRGSLGEIEIVNGVEEGDKVILFLEE